MVVAAAAAKSTVGSLIAAIGTGDASTGFVGFFSAASTSSHSANCELGYLYPVVESNHLVKLKSDLVDLPSIETGDVADGCVGFLRAASTSSHVGGSVESNGPVKLKSNFPDFPSRGAKKSGSGAGLNTERGGGVGSGSPFRVIEDKSGMTRINVF